MGNVALAEEIVWEGKLLAYIVRAGLLPEKTIFLTPSHLTQQVGFVVYPGGAAIERHFHKPLKREITGTSEVIIVKKGRCELDVYNHHRELVATRELKEGDLMLMIDGGHGFRMTQDTVLLEVKQGPYTGMDEKEKF